MKILGIETSCDETGVAFLLANESSKFKLKSHALYSQVNIHENYGGVVPELAARDHIKRLTPLIKKVCKAANYRIDEIDMIAYAKGPGLASSLLVGATIANSLALAINKPIIGINHVEAHLLSSLWNGMSLKSVDFPFIALLVSGGHTQIVLAKKLGDYSILGETLDDAAGEAFDKVAMLLGLSYPGGEKLSKLADLGQPSYFKFPRPMIYSKNLNFSFSGLKTAVLTQIIKLGGIKNISEQNKANIARAFVEAITEVIAVKCVQALKKFHQKNLIVAGGVSANAQLRFLLNKNCYAIGVKTHYPLSHLCTDNGIMIALAGAFHFFKNKQKTSFEYNLNIKPRWSLDQIESELI